MLLDLELRSLERLLAESPDAASVHGRAGECLCHNRAAELLMGHAGGALLGKTWQELLLPVAAAAMLQERCVRVLERGVPDVFELPALPDRRVVEVAVSPVRGDAGVPEAIVVIARDVTARKDADARRARECEMSEMLFRVGASLAALRDHASVARLVTEEVTRITGARFGVFFREGGSEIDALSGEPEAALADILELCALSVRGSACQGRPVRVDDVRVSEPEACWSGRGAPKVTSYLAAPIVSAKGEILGGLFLGHSEAARFGADHERVVSAIASQAAAALEQARLDRAVRASEEQAKAACEQARRADQRKDEFLAMLGHELRNPLAPIVTALELLKLRRAPGAQREREVIERQVAHLTRLVDDLLDISRITGGKTQLKRQSVELGVVVMKAIEMASPLFELRAHHLSVDVPRERLLLLVDPVRLAQVLANLLNNAAKYTPPGGNVSLRAVRDREAIVIRVRDNGMGIPKDALGSVFEPFVQGARSLDRAEGGLGIGLTLAKSLARLHGGDVTAHSEGPGLGSEFVVRLPLDCATLAPEQPPVEIPEPCPSCESARRVLVVDDNPDAAALLAEGLLAIGHVVAVAHDGPEALSTAASFLPDAAVLDIGLPVMDGYELARRLRAQPGGGGLRLVAVTGYGQETDKARSRAAGFDEHLVKPVELDVLADAITRRVSRIPLWASHRGGAGSS